jgi:hypothetical protein
MEQAPTGMRVTPRQPDVAVADGRVLAVERVDECVAVKVDVASGNLGIGYDKAALVVRNGPSPKKGFKIIIIIIIIIKGKQMQEFMRLLGIAYF